MESRSSDGRRALHEGADAKRRIRRALWAGVLLLPVLLVAGSGRAEPPACPDSTQDLGARFVDGTCTITTDTTWANGTLVLRGDLVVRDARLSMENVTLRLDPAFEQEWRIFVDGGALVGRDGAIASNATDRHWRLETSNDSATLVDLDGVAISGAGANGGGPYSAFALAGGNGHRFRRLAVTDSAINPDWHHAVFSTWSPGITDLRIENSTFLRTGRVLQMVAAVDAPSQIVFRGNRIENFDGTGGAGAIYGYNLDVVDNVMDTGDNQAVWIAHGGGPAGVGGAFHHDIAGNRITTGQHALFVTDVSGYSIVRNEFRGRVFVGGSGNDFAFNAIRDLDAHDAVVTLLHNGTVRHNVWRNVTLHEQAALVNHGGYGNVSFFANDLELACAGTNCMAIEVINVQDEQGPTFPGFPTVEVAWNNVTWVDLAPGSKSVTLDHEFSRRLHVHHNTQRVLAPAGASDGVTTAILAGGLADSVVEHNVMRGPMGFGIYHFIYEDAANLFQFNTLSDTAYAGIFQAGGSTIRHNRVEGATHGWWICPNRPCAGAAVNPRNLTFYDNAIAFRPGGGNVTRMTWPDYLNHTFIGRGPTWTNDSESTEPVHGGWLYFANDTIERVAWANLSGARRVAITVQGSEYDDVDPDFGAAGTAAIAVSGAIDRKGSVDAATVLWSLNPDGITRLGVTAAGPFALEVTGFRPRAQYRVAAIDLAGQEVLRMLWTDLLGRGLVVIPATGPADVRVSPLPRGPPIAAFSVSPGTGPLGTAFTADASVTRSPRDDGGAFDVRWDWEDDGTWDSKWSSQAIASHAYDRPGTYAIRLEVRDARGATDDAVRVLHVLDVPRTTEPGREPLPWPEDLAPPAAPQARSAPPPAAPSVDPSRSSHPPADGRAPSGGPGSPPGSAIPAAAFPAVTGAIAGPRVSQRATPRIKRKHSAHGSAAYLPPGGEPQARSRE